MNRLSLFIPPLLLLILPGCIFSESPTAESALSTPLVDMRTAAPTDMGKPTVDLSRDDMRSSEPDMRPSEPDLSSMLTDMSPPKEDMRPPKDQGMPPLQGVMCDGSRCKVGQTCDNTLKKCVCDLSVRSVNASKVMVASDLNAEAAFSTLVLKGFAKFDQALAYITSSGDLGLKLIKDARLSPKDEVTIGREELLSGLKKVLPNFNSLKIEQVKVVPHSGGFEVFMAALASQENKTSEGQLVVLSQKIIISNDSPALSIQDSVELWWGEPFSKSQPKSIQWAVTTSRAQRPDVTFLAVAKREDGISNGEVSFWARNTNNTILNQATLAYEDIGAPSPTRLSSNAFSLGRLSYKANARRVEVAMTLDPLLESYQLLTLRALFDYEEAGAVRLANSKIEATFLNTTPWFDSNAPAPTFLVAPVTGIAPSIIKGIGIRFSERGGMSHVDLQKFEDAADTTFVPLTSGGASLTLQSWTLSENAIDSKNAPFLGSWTVTRAGNASQLYLGKFVEPMGANKISEQFATIIASNTKERMTYVELREGSMGSSLFVKQNQSISIYPLTSNDEPLCDSRVK